MADKYAFISSEQVTVFFPPNLSLTFQQISAQAIQSGIYFLHMVSETEYKDPAQVASDLNSLAGWLDTFAAQPGVVGISAVQEQNAQNQLEDKLDVTVESTSGRSTTVIRTNYPLVEFETDLFSLFTTAVEQARAELDAVEGA